VFGNDARDTGLPPEVWRYYLLANRPETADTDFKWSDLQVFGGGLGGLSGSGGLVGGAWVVGRAVLAAVVVAFFALNDRPCAFSKPQARTNSELLKNLGNLVNR
jgi:hypothetical protein